MKCPHCNNALAPVFNLINNEIRMGIWICEECYYFEFHESKYDSEFKYQMYPFEKRKKINIVNEKCFFKECLVSNNKKNWYRRILVGKYSQGGPYYGLFGPLDHYSDCTAFGYMHVAEYDFAKRCSDVVYGDEDE